MIEKMGGGDEGRANALPEPRYQEPLRGADSVAARPETVAPKVPQGHTLGERPTVELPPLQKEPEKPPEKIRASVIINAYNEEAEIGRLLDSLGKSWFPGVEIIISDDGSMDRTADIVRKYIGDAAEEKPRDWLVLDSHENLGFVGAKNAGAAHARGEYLFFFDADAPMPNGLLQEDLRQMQDRGLDIATHHLKTQHKLQSRKTALMNKLVLGLENLFPSTSTMPGCGGILVKKSVFDEIGGFMNTRTGIGEDFDLSTRVSQIPGIRSGFIEGVRMPVNMRRFEKNGYVRTFWKHARAWIDVKFGEWGLPILSPHYRPIRRKSSISRQDLF